jgi:hypothetical protein
MRGDLPIYLRKLADAIDEENKATLEAWISGRRGQVEEARRAAQRMSEAHKRVERHRTQIKQMGGI